MITHSSCPTAAQYHYKGDFTMNENTNVQIITLFPLADSMPPQLINNVSVTAKLCRERHIGLNENTLRFLCSRRYPEDTHQVEAVIC